MNELVKFEKDIAVLDKETANKLLQLELIMKDFKEQHDKLKKAILLEMERNNIIKIETDDLIINYIQSSDRETFDKTKFKSEYPLMYDEFVTMKPVKPSIRVKVK